MAEKSTSKKGPAVAGSNKKVVRSKPPAHPKTSEMVLAAVTALKDRKGSSLQAIKKYMGSTYKVDTDKTAIFIRRYLKKAVEEGVLVQAKGSGASGSFKLPSSEKKPANSSTDKKRGRPAKSVAAAAAADAGKKKSSPKKKKLGSATTKKAGATTAKKPKVKSTATTKKKPGRPKGAKSTPKKKK